MHPAIFYNSAVKYCFLTNANINKIQETRRLFVGRYAVVHVFRKCGRCAWVIKVVLPWSQNTLATKVTVCGCVMQTRTSAVFYVKASKPGIDLIGLVSGCGRPSTWLIYHLIFCHFDLMLFTHSQIALISNFHDKLVGIAKLVLWWPSAHISDCNTATCRLQLS